MDLFFLFFYTDFNFDMFYLSNYFTLFKLFCYMLGLMFGLLSHRTF